MSKYIGAGFVALGLLFSVMFVPPVQAAGLTDQQVQSILSLLSSFGADQSTISNVSAALHGQTTSGPSSTNTTASSSITGTASPVCLSLTENLSVGLTDPSTNGQVSQLQQFLGINPTGYFGSMTEQAVQGWQSSHGIVSSGSPDTTGFGFVGPKTRTTFGCGGQTTNPTTINNPTTQSATFTAAPTSGPAPLAVQFTSVVPQGGNAGTAVSFGDGTVGPLSGSCIGVAAIQGEQGGIQCTYTVSHTYAAAGTYMATLLGGNTCQALGGTNCPLAPTQILGSVTITVTGTTQVTTPPSTTSGITGQIFAYGCPAQQPGTPCGSPYQGTVNVYAGTNLVASTQSDANGNFTVQVPAGDYSIRASGLIGACKPQPITVTAQSYTTVNLSCSNGME